MTRKHRADASGEANGQPVFRITLGESCPENARGAQENLWPKLFSSAPRCAPLRLAKTLCARAKFRLAERSATLRPEEPISIACCSNLWCMFTPLGKSCPRKNNPVRIVAAVLRACHLDVGMVLLEVFPIGAMESGIRGVHRHRVATPSLGYGVQHDVVPPIRLLWRGFRPQPMSLFFGADCKPRQGLRGVLFGHEQNTFRMPRLRIF